MQGQRRYRRPGRGGGDAGPQRQLPSHRQAGGGGEDAEGGGRQQPGQSAADLRGQVRARITVEQGQVLQRARPGQPGPAGGPQPGGEQPGKPPREVLPAAGGDGRCGQGGGVQRREGR